MTVNIQKDSSINALKAIAAILITNSHMGPLYTRFDSLATGAAIGNSLFFFVSGFTLAASCNRDFTDWYQRRLSRILPPIFAWAIISALIWGGKYNVVLQSMDGFYWFIPCILAYYVIFHFLMKRLAGKMPVILIAATVAVFGLYFILGGDRLNDSNIWTAWKHIYGKLVYFLFMMFGAVIRQLASARQGRKNPFAMMACFIICTVVFYGILEVAKRRPDFIWIEAVTTIPMFGILYSLYFFFNAVSPSKAYNSRPCQFFINLTGGCCLEIYLVQFALFTTGMNHLFPLNIVLMLLIIIAAAYLLRIASRFIGQTFSGTPYSFKKMTEL